MAAAHIPAQGNNEQTEDHTGRQDHIAQDGKVWVLDQSEKIKGKGKQHQGDTDGGDGADNDDDGACDDGDSDDDN